MTYLTFGSDPEFGLLKKGGRRATSVHMLSEWTDFSTKAEYSSGTCKVKKDGFAVELNPSQGSCRDYQVPNMGAALRSFLRKYPLYTLSAKPRHILSAMSTRGKNLPEGVMEYGCNPDRDAYTLQEQTPPASGYPNNSRFTGGHLHFSLYGQNGGAYDPRVPEPEPEFYAMRAALTAVELDLRLALPFVAILGDTNDYGEAARRKFYGRAGSHRVKPYGIEYRVLSSMVVHSPILYTWAIGQARGAIDSMPFLNRPTIAQGTEGLRTWFETIAKEVPLDDVRAIIDEHNVAAARELVASDIKGVKKYMYMPSFYDTMVEADKKGVGFDPQSMVNWGLEGDKVIIPRSHGYIAVESALRGTWNNYFPQKKFQKAKVGW